MSGSRHLTVKEKIIESAIKIFSKYGYSNASIRMIAEEAGVSKALIFWYFNSKDELIIEICKRALPIDVFETCLSKKLDGSSLLRCLANEYLNKYNNQLMRSILIHTLAVGDMYPEIHNKLDSLCNKMLKEVAKQVFKSDSKESFIKMRMFFGSLLCCALRPPQDISKDEYVNTIIKILYSEP